MPDVVSQWTAAVPGDDLGHLGDGIEDTGGCLAMNGEDVADRLVVAEHAVEPRQVGRRVLRGFERCRGAAGNLGNPERALAVGAVDQHQELAGLGHERGDHRLDGKGARALHRHRDVRALPARQLDDLVEHHAVDAQELGIARAPVVDHGLLDAG